MLQWLSIKINKRIGLLILLSLTDQVLNYFVQKLTSLSRKFHRVCQLSVLVDCMKIVTF